MAAAAPSDAVSRYDDTVWQSPQLANQYLSGVRAAIPAARLQIDVMLRLLRELGRPVGTFLDLGCGDGTLGSAILAAWPEARGTFLDFSDAMFDAAREKLGDSPGRRFVSCDYGHAGWTETVSADAPYDAVVSGYSIRHQPDAGKRRVYADIYEMLAPGGLFINIEHVLPTSILGQKVFEEHFTDNLYEQEAHAGGPRNREHLRREFLHRDDGLANRLSPISDQLGWLHDIGFRDVDCYFKLYELAVLAARRPV